MNKIKSAMAIIILSLCGGFNQAWSSPELISLVVEFDSLKMTLKVNGYKSGEMILPETGTNLAFLTNDKGIVLENSVVLSSDYDNLILNGTGNNFEILFSFGDNLKQIGGVAGFSEKLTELTGVEIQKPEISDEQDIVMALVSADQKIVVAAGKFRITKR
jgi:hypothetical protein